MSVVRLLSDNTGLMRPRICFVASFFCGLRVFVFLIIVESLEDVGCQMVVGQQWFDATANLLCCIFLLWTTRVCYLDYCRVFGRCRLSDNNGLM